MIEQLEKVLEQRTTVKYFDGNPIPNHITNLLKKSVSQSPSFNDRYNFKVKVLGQNRKDRVIKVKLHDYVCTLSKKEMMNKDDCAEIRSPYSISEAHTWQQQGLLSSQINGQTLAPLLFVWYIADKEPKDVDYVDIGLSCWNSIITAEALGIQSGFCACFDKSCLQELLNISGLPMVMIGYGFASDKIVEQKNHKAMDNIIS